MSFSSAKEVFAKVTPVKENKTYVVNQRLYALKTRSGNIQLIEGQKYPGQDIFLKRCFDAIRNRSSWTRDLGLLDYAPRVDIDRKPLYNKQERNGSKFTRMYIVRYVGDDGTADEDIHTALVRLMKVLIKDSEMYFAENPHFKRKDVNAELSVPSDWNLTSAVGGKPLEYYIDSDKVVEMMKNYWYHDFFKENDQSEWASSHGNDIDNFFVRPFSLQALSLGCENDTSNDTKDNEQGKHDDDRDKDSNEDNDDDDDSDHNEPNGDRNNDTGKPEKKGATQSSLFIPDSRKCDKGIASRANRETNVSQYFDEEAKEINEKSSSEHEFEESKSDSEMNTLVCSYEDDVHGNGTSFLTPPTLRRSYRRNSHNVLEDTSSDEEKVSAPRRSKRMCKKRNELIPRQLFPK